MTQSPTAIVRLTSIPLSRELQGQPLLPDTRLLIDGPGDGTAKARVVAPNTPGASGLIGSGILRFARRDLERLGWESGLIVRLTRVSDGLDIAPLPVPTDDPSFTDPPLHEDGLPIPPHWLAQAFTSSPDLESFLLGGASASKTVSDLAVRHGKPIQPGMRVFDFGCGCGRLSRCFLASGADVIGSDLHKAAIEWTNRHLPSGRFYIGSESPPLPEQDSSMDLIVAISVLTHMDSQMQVDWFAEWARVLMPEGLLVATFNSEAFVRKFLAHVPDYTKEIRDQWSSRDGIAFINDGGWENIFPDSYQTTYQTIGNLEEASAIWFKVEEYLEAGKFSNRQDLVVLKRM